jgi:hypothetical protein
MLRVIIFCDICNQQGVRYIEQQRSTHRGDDGGRRVTDGRSWYEGTFAEAEQLGWEVEADLHTCPRCKTR